LAYWIGLMRSFLHNPITLPSPPEYPVAVALTLGKRALEQRDILAKLAKKQRPNPPQNGSQFAVWWFKVVIRIRELLAYIIDSNKVTTVLDLICLACLVRTAGSI
jgi:hypothetical protein